MMTWQAAMTAEMSKTEQKQMERLLRKPNRTVKQNAKIRALAVSLGYDDDEIEYMINNM